MNDRCHESAHPIIPAIHSSNYFMAHPSVTVEQFYKGHGAALQMRLLAGGSGMKRVIREPTVNRPGLALSGFTHYFAYKRVQAVGNAEVYFLRRLSAQIAKGIAPPCSPSKSRVLSSAATCGRTRNFWRRRPKSACRFFRRRW